MPREQLQPRCSGSGFSDPHREIETPFEGVGQPLQFRTGKAVRAKDHCPVVRFTWIMPNPEAAIVHIPKGESFPVQTVTPRLRNVLLAVGVHTKPIKRHQSRSVTPLTSLHDRSKTTCGSSDHTSSDCHPFVLDQGQLLDRVTPSDAIRETARWFPFVPNWASAKASVTQQRPQDPLSTIDKPPILCYNINAFHFPLNLS